jgi:hypothetical protein
MMDMPDALAGGAVQETTAYPRSPATLPQIPPGINGHRPSFFPIRPPLAFQFTRNRLYNHVRQSAGPSYSVWEIPGSAGEAAAVRPLQMPGYFFTLES